MKYKLLINIFFISFTTILASTENTGQFFSLSKKANLASEITARDMQVKSSVGKQRSESNGHSKGGHATIDTNLSFDVILNVESSGGKHGGIQHTHSQLKLGKTKLQIEKDMLIQGQVETTSVEGQVGGDVRVETLLDTMKGIDRSVGGSIGFGIGLSSGKVSGEASYGQGKEASKVATMQGGFTSQEEFKLAVGGKTYLKGGVLGSEQVGKTDLATQEIIKEDIDTYQRSSNWKVGGSVNGLKGRGSSEVKKGGKVDFSYNRSNARQKVVSNVGPSKPPIDYLNTQSELKVDSQMAKLGYDLATDGGKVGKEIKDDFITVGLGGRAVLAGIVNVGKTGVVGAIEVIQRGLAATGGVIELTQQENEKGELAQAEGSGEFEKVLEEKGDQLQEQLGVKKKAKIKLYQGDSEELQGSGHDKNNASFEERGNQINYNTARKGFKDIATIADDLVHESTHKVISETKFAKQLINNDQEEAVARIVGKQARHVANAFKDKDRSKPSRAANDQIEWNKKNREGLKANNQKLSGVKGEEVKASSTLLADKSVFSGKRNPLEEQEYLEKAQEARLARKAAGEPIYEYSLPVLGPLLESGDATKEGDPVRGVRLAGQGLLEALPSAIVAGLVTKGLGAVAKGARVLAKPGVQHSISKSRQIEKSLGLNPFTGKTFAEIDQMFKSKGFLSKGTNPLIGNGSYINPKTGTRYYLDKGGVYKKGLELPHVDIWHNQHPSIEKVKYFLDNSPKQYTLIK